MIQIKILRVGERVLNILTMKKYEVQFKSLVKYYKICVQYFVKVNFFILYIWYICLLVNLFSWARLLEDDSFIYQLCCLCK